MFIWSSILRGLEFSSVNHISIYENFDTKVFKNIKLWVKYPIIVQIILLGTNVYKPIADSLCWQHYNGLIIDY